MRRYYAYVGDRRVHYRRAGSGPPIVMLPPLPGSSALIEALISNLATRHTVIALDIAGYGESEGLDAASPCLHDYARWLDETVSSLCLDHFSLYAHGASAMLALTFAGQYPDRVHRLVLDNPGLLSASERAAHLQQYCPPFSPDTSGSHITAMWSRQRDIHIFAPWFERTERTRIHRNLPPTQRLHDEVIDLFRAGARYDLALRASWQTDWTEVLVAVKCPILMILPAHAANWRQVVPDAVRVVIQDEDPACSTSHTLDFLQEASDPAPAEPPHVTSKSGAIRRDYVDSPVGELLIRTVGSGPSRPLVLFHGSPTSGHGLEPLANSLSTDRQVVIFDTPGNGDSPPLAGQPEMDEFAAVVVEAIKRLGFDSYDVYGTHTGAMLGLEVAIADAARVHNVVADGVTMFSSEEQPAFVSSYLHPLELTSEGSHLTWAWQFKRDMGLWFPWFARDVEHEWRDPLNLDGDSLHRSFVEFIKGGQTFHVPYRAALVYPTAERLPLVQPPVLLCCRQRDVLRDHVVAAAPYLRRGEMRFTPNNSTGEELAQTLAIYRNFYADGA